MLQATSIAYSATGLADDLRSYATASQATVAGLSGVCFLNVGLSKERSFSVKFSKVGTIFGRSSDDDKHSTDSDEDEDTSSHDIFVSGLSRRRWLRSRVVSRAHAQVYWDEDALLIQDLSSTHGTFVIPASMQSTMDFSQINKSLTTDVKLSNDNPIKLRNNDIVVLGKRVEKSSDAVYEPAVFHVSFLEA